MIIEITQSQFHKLMNESDHYKKWSYDSLNILWEWYEEQESENGQPTKFDFVLIRSCWAEYDSYKDLRDDHCQEKSLSKKEFLEWLEDKTIVFKLPNGGFLIWTDY